MDNDDLQRLLDKEIARRKQLHQTRTQRRNDDMNFNLDAEEKTLYTKYKGRAIKIGGFVVAAIIGQSSDVIQPGYKGVQFSLNGGLKQEIKSQGLRWHMPWVDVTPYPVSTETVYLTKKDTKQSPGDESFDINTSDGKSVNVDVVYSYHMEADKLTHIFTKFRRKEAPEIEETYLKTQLKTVMQEVSTRYGVLNLYAEQRDKATLEMKDELAKLLKKDGIILESFAMSDVRPDKQTLKSLQAIADAQNKNEYLKREQKNSEQKMINDKIDADNAAQVKVIQAQATAKETQIKAEAQAQANKKLEQSLTPAIIQDNWIKAWNGELPQVQGGNTPMIQIPQSK